MELFYWNNILIFSYREWLNRRKKLELLQKKYFKYGGKRILSMIQNLDKLEYYHTNLLFKLIDFDK